MDSFDRVVPLKGIFNFRDYGGYKATEGRIRRGLLWRSGQHAGATPEDLEQVHRLRIKTVVDLRGDSERQKYPCLRHDEFDGAVVFHPGETAGRHGQAAHEEFADIRTAAQAHAAMNNLYVSLPWRPILVATFRLYFDTLTDSDGPSLLHCYAGKDRTGVAAALTHHLLGVHPDDIVADYVLTNTAADPEARIAASSDHIRSTYGKNIEPAAIRAILNVHPDYLETSFSRIIERHGSVEAYADEVLGMPPARVEQMRERLVE